jgi:hypothetical protein
VAGEVAFKRLITGPVLSKPCAKPLVNSAGLTTTQKGFSLHLYVQYKHVPGTLAK